MGKSWALQLGVQGLERWREFREGHGAESGGEPEGLCGGTVCQIQMIPGCLECWWGCSSHLPYSPFPVSLNGGPLSPKSVTNFFPMCPRTLISFFPHMFPG